MKNSFLPFFLLGAFLLAACGVLQKTAVTNQPTSTSQPQPIPALAQSPIQDLARTDEQGAVTVEVKPDNLENPGDSLTFEISLNTHSVDLSMDLATLATLTTDNGHIAQATIWDAPRGGHHVSGELSFPASVDGKPFLDGATKLILTIKDLDAPEREFSWELQQ